MYLCVGLGRICSLLKAYVQGVAHTFFLEHLLILELMNSYDLSRAWFNYCFEHPQKVKPNHTALYFFCIEHCNRLGWKKTFGLPTTMTMEAIGIKSYNTYINTFNELIDFGFIIIIERSRNQYSSNIIELSKFDKAIDKALDKALIKHGTKQSESTQQSIDSIIKQVNKKQYNNKQLTKLSDCINSVLFDESKPSQESIDNIYRYYPTFCNVRNASTNKGKKDKDKIKKLLSSISEDKLIKTIEWYIADCKKSNTYIKNFSTFLNNLPDMDESKPSQEKKYTFKVGYTTYRNKKEKIYKEYLEQYGNDLELISWT